MLSCDIECTTICIYYIKFMSHKHTHTYIYIYIYIYIHIYIHKSFNVPISSGMELRAMYAKSIYWISTFANIQNNVKVSIDGSVSKSIFLRILYIYIYIQYCIYIYTHRIYTHACIWFKIYIGIAMANMTHVCSNMLARNVQHANLGRPNKHGKTYLHTCDIFDTHTHIYIQYTHTLYIYMDITREMYPPIPDSRRSDSWRWRWREI